MKEAIEAVISELEIRRRDGLHLMSIARDQKVTSEGYGRSAECIFAIELLKGVLARHETNDTDQSDGRGENDAKGEV